MCVFVSNTVASSLNLFPACESQRPESRSLVVSGLLAALERGRRGGKERGEGEGGRRGGKERGEGERRGSKRWTQGTQTSEDQRSSVLSQFRN